MKGSRLRSKFLNAKSEVDRKEYSNNVAIALLLLEKQSKHSLAISMQLI